MHTIIEPFRIKMTEPITISNREQREQWLHQADYNLFLLSAERITIDLLTDSGTGAMSSKQWAALMLGDESYAGSRSWEHFQSTINEITGFKHIFPVHQGRAAERILAQTRLKPGDIIPNNGHFDTTRANIEFVGAEAVDLIIQEGMDISNEHPFKGNMDVERLKHLIEEKGPGRIPFVMITITNNTFGGQPVSLENIKTVKNILTPFKIPLILDAARFAENAFLIREREHGQSKRPLPEIAREMFSYADGATMSAKKDGLSNIGGFFACNNNQWAEDFKNMLILTEGFPTYGGLAGRDLEAIAVGLREALEIKYQIYRHATVEYMKNALLEIGVPILLPAGGHAIYVNAKQFLPHISPTNFPGISLINALYLEGGIRAVEMGSVMFGKRNPKTEEDIPAPFELVRLTFPRRVYTQSHFDFVVEVLKQIGEQRNKIPRYKITKQPEFLRHFSAHFQVEQRKCK